jgi:hypothetical protein
MLLRALQAVFGLATTLPAAVSFNRDIRPIFADTCYRCHGPDKSARMMNLRLDIREEALKPTLTGVTPIVPGEPERSAIIQRVFAPDPARRMPPPQAHKDLTDRQKQLLRQWVAEGAVYEGHWAYHPVRRPAVPEVAGTGHPIDAFVQERLRREGLSPSAEADPRTLIRRVSLDLTGLPPTPAEVEAFARDPSPQAYERLVDRLLASPRYAEKQAMHWLDAVRYADTCGFHGDNPFPAWPYRDYVLRAFRDNKPFDQFTREQLAGDLLPGATPEQRVASAYNRLTRTSAEGGVQPKEYLAKYAADRVRTTASVWLGATVGCAECHDHKFDPITARDFYSLKAFFADIDETGLVPDRGEKAWGTQIALPTDDQRRRLEDLDRRLTDARRKLTPIKSPPDLMARVNAGEFAWRLQRPIAAAAANGARLTIYNDEPVERTYLAGASIVTERVAGNGLVVASGPNPENETYTITLRPGPGTWTALGLEVVRDESLPGLQMARGADRFVLTEVEAGVPFVLATSDLTYPHRQHPAMAAIDGDPATGWGISTYGEPRNPFLALRFAQPLVTTADSTLTVRLRQDSRYRRATLGRFRLALSAARHSWPKAPEDNPRRKTAPRYTGFPEGAVKDPKVLQAYLQWASPDLEPLIAEIARLEAERHLLDASIPRAVVTQVATPRETRILPRGNWMDDSGEIVEPSMPAFLGKLDTGGRRATRLDLANWIVSRDNPLAPRVFVNRLWRQFFGIGISKVLDDLGSQGEWPVHPELLDWLAAEFAESWDVQRLIRLIVTSHTYKQSSRSTPQLDERDPDNRLLARQSRFRLDAELVRDAALAVSGLLADRFGGPSVRPYQPEGYLAALNFPKREYSASRGDDLYRRGVYTHWQRTFLHPSLMTFDAPSREECTVNRVNSNTPLQALVLLNDPIYVEAARVFAQNTWKDGGAVLGDRIVWAFSRALSRRPSPEEQRLLAGLYEKNLRRFRAEPASARELLSIGDAPLLDRADPAELAALMTVARALLNLHETITRN